MIALSAVQGNELVTRALIAQLPVEVAEAVGETTLKHIVLLQSLSFMRGQIEAQS